MNHHSRPFPILIVTMALIAVLTPFNTGRRHQADADKPKLYDYDFRGISLDTCIQSIIHSECLAVQFTPSSENLVKQAKVTLKLKNASPMRALNLLLTSQRLNYEYLDYKTLVVFQDAMPESVTPTSVIYRDGPFSMFINQVAEREGFTAELLEQTFKQERVTTEIKEHSLFRAFEVILQSKALTYERVACNTVIIFRDQSFLAK